MIQEQFGLDPEFECFIDKYLRDARLVDAREKRAFIEDREPAETMIGRKHWHSYRVKAYVEEKGIRDAVSFQDEASDANNHFVPLIINGEPRQLGGQGSGANPRTVIGQRRDGAVLLLVTDGRGTSGHLGATASDLISIMQDYDAINAANLDGGSSTTMVYNGEYEMTSVTFYYQNSSWKLPDAFVVRPKGGN